MKAEIHLGRPYAAPDMKCVYCGAPATRTTKMEGSITIGETKTSFTETSIEICFCDEHGIIIKDCSS